MNLPARLLRALLGAMLWLMIGVLIVLLLVSGLSAVFLSDDTAWKIVGWLAVAATAGGIVALFFVSRWLREKPWGGLAAGYAVVVPVLLYAMKDDAEFKRPLTLAELSPAPARAEESWLVTLWYSPRADRLAERTMPEPGYIVGPAGDPEKWAAHLEKNRDQVRQAWEKIAREREWFATMNAFPAIGDLTPARFEAPIIQFKPFRTVVQLSCARAGLLALDDRGDEAIGGLLLKTTIVRYDKVVDNYWKKEDQRLALLAELRRPP